MEALSIIGIIAAGVSIILAIVAISFSVHFYTQSKNTETNVINALSSIKAQVDTLQKLTGKWMDRLTKYATEPRGQTEAVAIVSALKELPASIAAQLPLLTQDRQEQPEMTDALITSYISIYYYVAVANYAMQGYLPPLEDVIEDDYWKKFLDLTYQDFLLIERLLNGIEPTRIQNNLKATLYDNTVENWRDLVRDSTMVYSIRSAS